MGTSSHALKARDLRPWAALAKNTIKQPLLSVTPSTIELQPLVYSTNHIAYVPGFFET